jgi:glutathione S-transferase
MFTVHTVPGSPFARAVCATLEEKKARWRVAGVAPERMKQEEHLARHPFGRVPVLEHDAFLLYETQAILRYLDRVLPEPPLTPCDARDAARMDQVMNVNDWYLFQGCTAVIGFQRVVGPRLLGLTPDEAAIREAIPRARLVLAELSRLLGDCHYFAGRALSLADLIVAPQLDMLSEAPEWSELSPPHPNIVDWLSRMAERRSMSATSWAKIAQMAA